MYPQYFSHIFMAIILYHAKCPPGSQWCTIPYGNFYFFHVCFPPWVQLCDRGHLWLWGNWRVDRHGYWLGIPCHLFFASGAQGPLEDASFAASVSFKKEGSALDYPHIWENAIYDRIYWFDTLQTQYPNLRKNHRSDFCPFFPNLWNFFWNQSKITAFLSDSWENILF